VPTIYGTAFIEHARGVIAQIRQAGRALGDLAAADAGTVTVGTHLAGSNVLLPLAIARLKAAHPGVTVIVRESTPDVLQSQLLLGDVDLTVGRLTPADPLIEQVQLYVEPIVLVVRADHPVLPDRGGSADAPGRPDRGGSADAPGLSGRGPSFATLAALPWIVPVAGTALRRELEQLFAAQGVAWPSDRVECTSALTLRRLILDGDCVAALPELVALHDDDLAIVTPADVDLGRLTRPVGVSTVRDRWQPPAVTAFLEDLATVAGELRG
jgi:DNA-binding transcriptional LysR family regulator